MGKTNLILASLALIACGNIALFLAKKPVETDAMSRSLDEWVTKTEKLVVPAAEAMPEEKYLFAPTNGEFAGVRIFAEQVKHLAAANYQLGALVLGEKPPHGEHGEVAPGSVRTKAEILEYLNGSFAYLHKVAATTHAKNVAEQIEMPRGARYGHARGAADRRACPFAVIMGRWWSICG